MDPSPPSLTQDIASEVLPHIGWESLITLLSTTRAESAINAEWNTQLHKLGYPSVAIPHSFLCLVDTKKSLKRVLVDVINTGVEQYYRAFTKVHPNLLRELLEGSPMEDNNIYRLEKYVADDILRVYRDVELTSDIADTYLGHSKKGWKLVVNDWAAKYASTSDSNVRSTRGLLAAMICGGWVELPYSIFIRGVLMAIEKYDCRPLHRYRIAAMFSPGWVDHVIKDVPLLVVVNYEATFEVGEPKNTHFKALSSSLIRKARKTTEARYAAPLSILNPRWVKDKMGLTTLDMLTTTDTVHAPSYIQEVIKRVISAIHQSYEVADVGPDYVNTVISCDRPEDVVLIMTMAKESPPPTPTIEHSICADHLQELVDILI